MKESHANDASVQEMKPSKSGELSPESGIDRTPDWFRDGVVNLVGLSLCLSVFALIGGKVFGGFVSFLVNLSLYDWAAGLGCC